MVSESEPRPKLNPQERFNEAMEGLVPLVREEIVLTEKGDRRMIMYPSGGISFAFGDSVNRVTPNEGDPKSQWEDIVARYYNAFLLNPSSKLFKKQLKEDQVSDAVVQVLNKAKKRLSQNS